MEPKILSGNEWKRKLFLAMLFTFAWGLAAHGYCFLQSSFSHDSLNEFNAADGGNAWKIQLGRVLVPLYRAVFRTDLTLPWMIGLLSLVWTGLAVYLVARILRMESGWMLFLTAGVMTVNLTVISGISTYINDHDSNMLAMLCAVAAVWLWQRSPRGFLPGAVLVAVSMGIYQSFVCVSITLVIFVCVLELLDGEKFGAVFGKGMKAIAMLLLGGVVYLGIMKLVLKITGIPLSSGSTNGLDQMANLTLQTIPSLVYYAYLDCWNRLVNCLSPYSGEMVKAVTLVLLGITFAGGITALCSRRVGWLEKLLVMVLVGLLPLGMNLMFVLTSAIVHDLMVYALWLVYLPALLMAERLTALLPEKWGKGRAALNWTAMALVFALVYGNVQTANVVYLKKDLEQDAYLSLMTRVVYEMEKTEGYEPGVTQVVFAGVPEQIREVIPGFEKYRAVTGADAPYVTELRTNYRAQRYFTYILSNPAVMAGDDLWNALQADPRVAEMPVYPADGCTAILDGVLVVKVG